MRTDRPQVRLSTVVAVVAAIAVVAGTGRYSTLALGSGLLGFALVTVAVLTERQALLTLGCAGLVAAVLAAGAGRAPTLVVLAGTVAAAVAWDSGRTALTLADQLGPTADVTRLELVSIGSTLAVGCVAGAFVWRLARVELDRAPSVAPLLLLVAGIALAGALYYRGDAHSE
ncbi:hypothetical protein ACFQL1_22160 [Halomicroarcula sp. GCM10025709]|uniref:DUF7519 family protein n=1 Tax=Haloarcula TaxID=2237 RepID=UPI0024C228E5|nr:hypothetical protein [Halomicroarcula sp. YJ-61-S]